MPDPSSSRYDSDMPIRVQTATSDQIASIRARRTSEMNCQIILYSWLGRGWSNAYSFEDNGEIVGYGLMGGSPERINVTEFYLLPDYVAEAQKVMRSLIEVSGASMIEAQSNDRLLTVLLFDFVSQIESHVILFEDKLTTSLKLHNANVRVAKDSDRKKLAELKLDTDANWLLEHQGEIVSAGGLLFHYNAPYGDIYMATTESARRRGYGSFFVQELKRIAKEAGKIPAARCNAVNVASRATLQKAGMLPCARMLAGQIDLGSTKPAIITSATDASSSSSNIKST